MLWDSTNTLKVFLPPAGCGSILPAKNFLLATSQVNMVEEAKLGSPIHSTFEALIVPRAIGICLGEELGPFC